MCTYLESCEPSRWIHAYFKPTMDGFKTTSNAAEQENNRLKIRHLRSCNLELRHGRFTVMAAYSLAMPCTDP
jgi:hypothetical protein